MTTTTTTTDNLLMIDGAYVAPTAKHYSVTYWSGQPRLRTRLLTAPSRVDLTLSSDTRLPKRHGKKIKAVGGRYGDVRGNAYARYVNMPVEAAALIDELIVDYGAKGKNRGIAVRVQSKMQRDVGATVATVAEALAANEQDVRDRITKGVLRLVTEADLVADDARYDREEHNYNCGRLASSIESALALIETTGVKLFTNERDALAALIARADAAKETK